MVWPFKKKNDKIHIKEPEKIEVPHEGQLEKERAMALRWKRSSIQEELDQDRMSIQLIKNNLDRLKYKVQEQHLLEELDEAGGGSSNQLQDLIMPIVMQHIGNVSPEISKLINTLKPKTTNVGSEGVGVPKGDATATDSASILEEAMNNPTREERENGIRTDNSGDQQPLWPEDSPTITTEGGISDRLPEFSDDSTQSGTGGDGTEHTQ